MYSECGEDGILDHIFNKLNLPQSSRFCVDIGACDGSKWSNTANLIRNRQWGGVLIEQDQQAFQQLEKNYEQRSDVKCIKATAATSNIESILSGAGVPKRFGLLSIDVEGNDYHVWKAISRYKPGVVVVDFNASIANDTLFIQKDSQDCHIGSSLFALTQLAAQKGYKLAAVTDWNAVFVEKEYVNQLGLSNEMRSLDQWYLPPFEMRIFQTLDGCLHMHGCTTLVRQDYEIEWEDFQVLPAKLRGRDNSFANFGKMRSVLYDNDVDTGGDASSYREVA